MKKILILLLVLMSLWGCSGREENVPAEKEDETASQESVISETGRIVNVQMSVKDYGTVDLVLYPDVAPITVENFVKLVKEGFYDGNRFHRIIDGFMIQGGMDTQGIAENIKGEFASNGFENDLKHKEGVISMARAKDPDSASSQFFIMVGDADWLDGEYAAFGQVASGYDVVKKIAADARPIDNNGTIKEEEMPIIEWIKITD